MRRTLKWAGIAVVSIVVIVGLGGCGGYVYLRASTLPQQSGELELSGLNDPVKVSREPTGVPHVRAENEHDLFFALGAVHAQDRLWQMDFQRRVGAGRLSEVLGESTVEQDKFLRTWGVYGAAEEAYKNLSPEGKRAVDAYVGGINAYLATDPPLPPEFLVLGYEPEKWRPADVLVWAKMQSFDLSANWESELERRRLLARGLSRERIRELMPPYPEDAPTILQEGDVSPPRADGEQAEALLRLGGSLPRFAEASNNWVVSGERTQSGEPLLANDPHLGLQVPSLWYLAHLESPSLEAVGATLPGLPGVVIGRNEEIAWGVTNVGADVQDLYVMDETGDGKSYLYKGEKREYRVRRETIRVNDGEDVEIEVRESVYGPVISDVVDVPGGESLSLRWTSLDPEDRTLEAFLGIDRARNWREFNDALEDYAAPSQNFVYADREGNIGYVAPGKFPLREGHSGLYPVPGDGSRDWRGYVPPGEWPRTKNPEEGLIVTANNEVAPESYPHTLSLEWAEPYRARRIRQMLEGKEKLSVEDMTAIQQDRKSLLYRKFLPILEGMRPGSARAGEWRERLLSWDGEVSPDSKEATVFEAWYTELTRLPGDEVGQEHWNEPRYLLGALKNGDPNCGGDCTGYAEKALQKALDRLGDPVPEWGDTHEAVFSHPVLGETPLRVVSDRRVRAGGDHFTVNVGPYEFDDFSMHNGPSYRHVVDLSDPDSSRYVHPMGQSGNPISGWFDNLLAPWRKGEYLPMRTEDYPVEKELTLKPR